MTESLANLNLQLLPNRKESVASLCNRAANYTILVFYRGFHCRICFRYIRRWAAFKSAFNKLGIEVAAVSSDSKEKAQQTQNEWFTQDLPLAYGLPVTEGQRIGLHISKGTGIDDPSEFTEPALFVLNKQGDVVISSIQNSAYARPDVEQLLEDLKGILAR